MTPRILNLQARGPSGPTEPCELDLCRANERTWKAIYEALKVPWRTA